MSYKIRVINLRRSGQEITISTRRDYDSAVLRAKQLAEKYGPGHEIQIHEVGKGIVNYIYPTKKW